MDYDLLIKNGRIVDGSGLPSYVADVGIKDNSSGDWACWADMRIESLEPSLRRAIPK